MSTCTSKLLTTAEAARQLGVGEWVIGRLARLGRIKLACLGRYWVVDDLAEVRRVLQDLGYLPPVGGGAAAAS
jgi:hypothetical protein